MIDVLFLKVLQRVPRFPQYFVLPGQQFGTKIIALAIVHERLFFGGSIIFQLIQGQSICTCKAPETIRPRRSLYSGAMWQTISSHPGSPAAPGFHGGFRLQKQKASSGQHQNCPVLASSTSTRSSISESTASRPGSPDEDFKSAAAARNRVIVEISKAPDSSPILRSPRTSRAPLPRCTERLRRSTGSSSTPCIASNASMFAVGLGASAGRLSNIEGESGSEKPVELLRRALAAGEPRVAPFGP